MKTIPLTFLAVGLLCVGLAQQQPTDVTPAALAEHNAKVIEAHEANETVMALQAEMQATMRQVQEQYAQKMRDADVARRAAVKAANDSLAALRTASGATQEDRLNPKTGKWEKPQEKKK